MFFTYNTKASIKFGLIIVSIIFLGYAIFTKQKYGFYISLKLVVCTTSLYLAFLSYESKQQFWLVRFVIVTVLYNPFMKLPLGKSIWIPVNTVTALFFAVALLRFRINYHETIDNPLVDENKTKAKQIPNESDIDKEIDILEKELEILKKEKYILKNRTD